MNNDAALGEPDRRPLIGRFASSACAPRSWRPDAGPAFPTCVGEIGGQRETIGVPWSRPFSRRSALAHHGLRILADRSLADRILADRSLADRGCRRRRLFARQI